MSTKAVITAAINDKIRDKTPKVLKVEHADVEQLITDESFPDFVKIEWNGLAAVSPIADIICNPLLTSIAKCKFTVYFWKSGNTVYVNGEVENIESSFAIGNITLFTFPTTTYKPITQSSIIAPLIINNSTASQASGFLGVSLQGGVLKGSIPFGINTYAFHGTYKVQN